MRQIHKIPAIVLTLILLLATNCKKGKETLENQSKTPTPNPTENLPSDPKNDKSLYPVQFQTGKSILLFTYSPTKALTKIDYGDDNTVTLDYTSTGVLNGLIRYEKTKQVFAIDFQSDLNGLLTGAKTYNVVNKKSSPAGSYIFKYAGSSHNNQPNTITYYNSKNEIIYEKTRTFSQPDNLGNLISSSNATTNDVNNNGYDTKNGLFKNVLYAWSLDFDKENDLLLSTNNNIKSIDYPAKPALNKTFDYTYNVNNYPSTLTTTVNGIKTITKITYQEPK